MSGIVENIHNYELTCVNASFGTVHYARVEQVLGYESDLVFCFHFETSESRKLRSLVKVFILHIKNWESMNETLMSACCSKLIYAIIDIYIRIYYKFLIRLSTKL